MPVAACANTAPGEAPTVVALGPPQLSRLPTLPSDQRERLRNGGGLDTIDLDWPLDQLVERTPENDPGRPCARRGLAGLDRLGKVRYAQGRYGFELDEVLGARGRLVSVGPSASEIDAWDIVCAPMPGTEVLQATTRDRVYALASRLGRLGWKRYIPLDQPRIAGRETLRYKLEGMVDAYALDPAWTPNDAEWYEVAAAMPRWHWVADGIHLELSLQDLVIPGGSTARRAKEVSPKDLYYARVRIRDELAYYNIARWPSEAARQDLERLRRDSGPKALESRKRAELDARRRGFHILTSYQTPPLPASP